MSSPEGESRGDRSSWVQNLLSRPDARTNGIPRGTFSKWANKEGMKPDAFSDRFAFRKEGSRDKALYYPTDHTYELAQLLS